MIVYNSYRVGTMNYIEKDNSTYTVSIKICNLTMLGKGIGTIAFSLLLNYLFNDLNASIVDLSTNSSNTGAMKFYERFGFKKKL